MKKKIVAYLLCMAMGVSLLPMPVTQAADQGAVVYEEDTTTGEELDSYVQIKGLKAFADCGNATNKQMQLWMEIKVPIGILHGKVKCSLRNKKHIQR